MRTTVTLDDDTERLVRDRMASRGVSFKQALNDAIREGSGEPEVQPFVMGTYDMGVPKVDLTKALQISAEIEDEHTLEVMGLVPRSS